MKRNWPSLFAVLTVILVALGVPSFAEGWKDVTSEAGLDGIAASRLKFTDLDGDHRADAVFLPTSTGEGPVRLFLNAAANDGSPRGFRFRENLDTGLPEIRRSDILVFADLDNDGRKDAILGRYLDLYQDDYRRPAEEPWTTSWFRGQGDGSFGRPIAIPAATLATTSAIAINDVNEDGRLDLYIGNWYERYFTGYDGFSNDLLLQYRQTENELDFARWPIPDETVPTNYEIDIGGRPTYGTAIVRLDDGLPMLLELNYGRRWNRLYRLLKRAPVEKPGQEEATRGPLVLAEPAALAQHLVRQIVGREIAAKAGIDGDAIRHGRHPEWPEELAGRNPRVERADEPPFRANGNTFDCAVGDIDNDGDFDLFLSTIIHAWAGESSDRSRFLLNQLEETGTVQFQTFSRYSVDRWPDPPEPGQPLASVHTSQNQGDIFAELADLNHDGRLDLVLCSSDYPDRAPYDERLRIYHQTADGRFADVTEELGVDHIGAGMPSLADVDGDGDLDLLVGQSFNRLPKEMRRQAATKSGVLSAESPDDARPEPRARLFLNESTEDESSLILYLQGDPAQGVSRDALGTIVKMKADLDSNPETPDITQQRQLVGPAGHAGKQSDFVVHFGMGDAPVAKQLEIQWPSTERQLMRVESLPPGRYLIAQGAKAPVPLTPST